MVANPVRNLGVTSSLGAAPRQSANTRSRSPSCMDFACSPLPRRRISSSSRASVRTRFDYRDANVVENIRTATGNAPDIAIDCVSEGQTTGQVPAALGDKGGKVAIVLPYQSPRPDITVAFTLAYESIQPVRSAAAFGCGKGQA
jgi:hypothetical protein